MEHVLTSEEQATIDAGIAAANLMQNETFQSVLNDVASTAVRGITSSLPKETRTREEYYFLHVALQSIHGILRARVAAAVALQESLDATAVEENLTNPAIDAGL